MAKSMMSKGMMSKGMMSKNMMSKDMMSKGVMQGDMSPMVEDCSRPMGNFSQEGFSKTLDYMGRQNSFVSKEASGIKSQGYMGRYS